MKLQWWSKSQAMVKGEISVCQHPNNAPLRKKEDRESAWMLLLNSQLEEMTMWHAKGEWDYTVFEYWK